MSALAKTIADSHGLKHLSWALASWRLRTKPGRRNVERHTEALMNRSLIGAIGASIALFTLVTSAGAQDGCGGVAEGVDLAVQSARLRERDGGWVVLYTVTNRGRMASTSYDVSLKIDGVESADDEYLIGLEP